MSKSGFTIHTDPVSNLLEEINGNNGEDMPIYSDVMRHAMRSVNPIFFRQTYADFFWHCATSIPGWLPRVIVACAQTENSGSGSLLDIWSKVTSAEDAEFGLISHAKDESRHSYMFLDLAKSVFPNFYHETYLKSVEENLVKFSDRPQMKSGKPINEHMLLDYLIQLNIVEIRTRLHLHLLAPAYCALTPSNNKDHVNRLINVLFADEGKHIGYTAKLIESIADKRSKNYIASLFICRLNDYNNHTKDHCNVAKNDYGQGRFPAFID